MDKGEEGCPGPTRDEERMTDVRCHTCTSSRCVVYAFATLSHVEVNLFSEISRLSTNLHA